MLNESVVWIGGTDIENEGTWLWVDGRNISTAYSNWYTGQPDNGAGNQEEHCLRKYHKIHI